MLPGSNFLSLNAVNIPLQVSDNKGFDIGDTELHASFAELLQLPDEDLSADLAAVAGELLPVDGSDMPPLATEPSSMVPLTDPVATEIAPPMTIAIIAAPEEPGKIAGMPLRRPESPPIIPGTTALPTDGAAGLTGDPDAASALQNLRSESDVTAYRERAGVGVVPPAQARQARSGPATTDLTPEQIADLAGDESLDANRLRQVVNNLAEPAANTPPRQSADSSQAPQLMAGMAPPRAVTADIASEGTRKTVPGVSASNTTNIVVDGSQATQALPTLPSRATPTLNFSINVPVTDDGFGEALQDRVMWMAGHRIQNAEIRLNPAELGPIRVQISVEDDAARLTFTAQHAVTRDAIEQAMPRLREMLSDSGLSLAGSSVHDGDAGETGKGRHAAHDRDPDAGLPGEAVDETGTTVSAIRQKDSTSLVDTFA